MKDDAVDDIPTPSVFQAVVGVPFVVGITATLLLNHLLLPASLLCWRPLLLNASMLLLASHVVAGVHAGVAGIPLVTHPECCWRDLVSLAS